MDKKELLQQLMHMKKEYAKKCKKLQLAVRAKNAREHVKKKIQEQNQLSTYDVHLPEELCSEELNSPIILSSKEKTKALTLSTPSSQNTDSCIDEKLSSKSYVPSNGQHTTSLNDTLLHGSSLKKVTHTINDSSGNFDKILEATKTPTKEDINLCRESESSLDKNIKNVLGPLGNSPEKKNNDNLHEKLQKEKNIDNSNADQTTGISERADLTIKLSNVDIPNCNDLTSSPCTIKRKRKYNASFRDILPQTVQSGIQPYNDINQTSSHMKPKQKRRSYKREEQNVILLSVLDYIVEEGKRDSTFREFQLPDSEYAHIKLRHLDKNIPSRNHCFKSKNSSQCQVKTKSGEINETSRTNFQSHAYFKKSPGNLENFTNQFPCLAKTTHQFPETENTISSGDSKCMSLNSLDSAAPDNLKNFQEDLLQTELSNTPKSLTKSKDDLKNEDLFVDSQDLNSSKIQICLPFTKTNAALDSSTLVPSDSKCTQFLDKSQDLLNSFNYTEPSNERKSLIKSSDNPKMLIDKQITNQESKISLDSQNILDSMPFDESSCNKAPFLPRCYDGLSQFSSENFQNSSVVPSTPKIEKVKNIPKRWQSTKRPITSPNPDDYHLHTKENSPHNEPEVYKSNHETESNKIDICITKTEAVASDKTVSQQHLSPLQSENISKENKEIKAIKKASCDKIVEVLETEKKSFISSLHSQSHDSKISQTSKTESNYNNENISSRIDVTNKETNTCLTVKTCVHNFSSFVCDNDELNHKKFQGFKEAETFKLPGINEKVISLLNSTFCPLTCEDLSPTNMELLVCVTQHRIYLWTLTKLSRWKIVHQKQITESEQCCYASLHPLQNGVGVATVLVSTDGQSRLVLHIFQMNNNIEANHLPITLQQLHKLLYSSLTNCSIAVARMSSDKTIDVCKYVMTENLSSIENVVTLDFSSDKLISLSTIQGLPAALLAFTANNILLIWNHVANVLLSKISLSNITMKSSMLPSAFTEQGQIVFPLIFDDGPEHGCLLALNPSTDVVVKLLSYERHFIPETKSDSRMAIILGGNLISVQDNVLEIWDLYSGSLLACVNSLGMTCTTVLHNKNKELLLITGHKQSCIHIYRSQPLQLVLQPNQN